MLKKNGIDGFRRPLILMCNTIISPTGPRVLFRFDSTRARARAGLQRPIHWLVFSDIGLNGRGSPGRHHVVVVISAGGLTDEWIKQRPFCIISSTSSSSSQERTGSKEEEDDARMGKSNRYFSLSLSVCCARMTLRGPVMHADERRLTLRESSRIIVSCALPQICI